MAYLRPSHACALGAILIATVIAPSAANAASPSIQGVPTDPAVDSTSWVTLPADITNSDAPVDVFIQTVGDGALAVQQQEKGHGAELRVASEKASDVATRNEEVADAVATDVTNRDEDATVLYTSAYSVPGVAVTADPDTLAAIAGRADVVKISRIVSRTLDLPDGTVQPQNSASDAFTRAVDAWQQTGRTGQDVTVAVIDTGIDYTHATFGGPGTEDAYRTALASTSTPDPAWYDASKYLGGWDFAGTTYNGTSGSLAYDPVPRPDANPIDGPGGNHGTHVTGTAVGFGVTPDGQTFRGDYGSLASENLTQEFSVGPGTAPRAGVLGLKVFGDGGGATSLTGAALEWIAKEIADGRKIDVVNMSLGTDGGAVDDPDNAKVNALLDAGVLPVIAAGNAGDVTDISGSPGNTERALTVAASATGHGLGDTVYAWNGDPAASPPRTLLAQYSQNFYGDFSVQARVARTSAENPTGCAPFSAQDTAIAQGKIVWLAWDERNMGCGTAVRFDNAAAAGAVGVLLESQGDSFEAGIAGNSAIPGAQLSASAVAALIPALEDGTLIVGLRSEGKNSRDYFDAKKSDTPASFTSRGTHGSIDDSLKPDVSAPGVSIVSAANGTGTGRAALSGTSMASPHVAGIAALVTEAHPDWSPDRIKQQIMNTAVHDVTTGGAEPVAYGPARVGDGRVDALAAVQTTAGIASVENGGLVSASFGVVEVGEDPVEQTRTIRLSNDEDSAREMSLAYLPRTETPGVAFSLSQDTVTIPARGSVEVTLTMSIADPSALRRTLDPTMDSSQGGAPRQYLADASGVLQATGNDGRAPIRMAVHVAPKPVSSTNVEGVVFDGNAGTLTNAGRGLDQGEGTQRYQSLMVPLVLGTEDPDDTFPETSAHETLESMDLREVGASSTAPLMEDPSQGVLTVGIVMDGEWATMSPLAYPMVQLDVNGDTRSDFAIILQRGAANTDLPMAITFDTVTGRTVDQRPVNGFFGDHGTNVFDNNVVSLSTSLAALGYTPGTTATTIRYIVQTRSYYAPGYDETYKGTLVDQSASVAFDVYHPPLTFGDEPTSVFTDQPGDLPVHRDAPTDARVLVLNLLAGHGNRSQIVTPASDGVTPGDGDPTPTPPSVSPPPVADPGGLTGAGDPQTSPHLAVTGVDGSTTLIAVALASAALVTGFVLLLVRRRRTRRRHG